MNCQKRPCISLPPFSQRTQFRVQKALVNHVHPWPQTLIQFPGSGSAWPLTVLLHCIADWRALPPYFLNSLHKKNQTIPLAELYLLKSRNCPSEYRLGDYWLGPYGVNCACESQLLSFELDLGQLTLIKPGSVGRCDHLLGVGLGVGNVREWSYSSCRQSVSHWWCGT